MARTGPEEKGPDALRGIRLGTLVLIAAIAAGAFLRFSGIGRYGFWTDELFHVFAAESYLRDGTLQVPWNPHPYTKALPVTLLTALSFKLLGPSEASARILFAFANVLFIVLGYLVLRRMFTRTVALIFVVASSFSTIGVQLSQECRMYTLFQLFYFLMSVAFIRGLERERGGAAPPRTGLLGRMEEHGGVSLAWLVPAGGLALLASRLQMMVANFAFLVTAYCLVMGLYLGLTRGLRGAIRSKYAVGVLVLFAGVFLFVLARGKFARGWLRVAMELPDWNRTGQSNFAFYLRVLIESHGIELALYPLGAFLAIHRYGRKGLFFVLSFVVLFLMHCFVFGRVSERYIFYLLPFLVAVSAIGLEFLLSAVAAFASRFVPALSGGRRTAFYAAFCLTVAFAVYPRVRHTVLDTSVPKFSNWKDLDPALIQAVNAGTSITTERYRFNYYFGKYPDFVLDVSDVRRLGGERMIVDVADMEKVVSLHPGLHLVTYNQQFFNDAFVSPEIRAYVLERLPRTDDESDERIMVFRSPSGSAASAGAGR